MTFGVTPEGLVIKRLADIREEMNEDARGVYGQAVDLDIRRPLGQFITIQAERLALIWELLEQLNNQRSPTNAVGKQFDEIASYAGLQRRLATYSTVGVILTGIEGTPIPAGKRASVEGNAEAIFATDAQYTIGPGQNEVQELFFSDVPVGGAFTLVFQNESTTAIPFDAAPVVIKNALQALGGISSVNVSGGFYEGFEIEFTGDDGESPQQLITIGTNTLSSDGVEVGDVTPTVARVIAGELPNVSGTMTATTAGPVPAPSGSLIVIEDSVTGWEGISNPLDAEEGSPEETDAEYKLRREQQLASAGRCTPNAIRARMLEVPDVESCTVYINKTLVTQDGIPGKSVRIVVVGGEPEPIAIRIFDVVGAGIGIFGDELYQLTDDSGFLQQIRWDYAEEIPIWVSVDLWIDESKFPQNGEDTIISQILAFGETLGAGDDVIVYPYLLCTLDVAGIIDSEIRVGTSVSPTDDDNIVIAADELAKFDSSRIVITIMS